MVVIAKNLPKERPRRTLQSLGGKDYALPDIVRPKWKRTAVVVILIALLFPILVFVLTLLTIIMAFGSAKSKGRIISYCVPFVMEIVENKTINQRKLLLQHLSGKVLDVGGGSGPYLKLIQKGASHVVIIEPIKQMHEQIRKNAQQAGFTHYQITIVEDTLENYVTLFSANNQSSFDWVILGNVLCTVPNAESALGQIHQVLKPGGHVYFSEHCASPPGTTLRKVQDCVNPWWKCVSGGCNCNRDCLDAIERMEEWDTISWELSGLPGFVMGLSRKVGLGV